MTGRILVVDDVAANLRLLEARLQAEYFDVRTADNGPDALEIARAERVDLVLLDVMMPGMDGFEVCRQLKAAPQTAHIPVVMVTALDHVDDRVQGLESGADDFLTKPVSDVALVTRVRSLLRLKMVTDELSLRAAAMQSVGIDVMHLDRIADTVRGRVLVVDDSDSSVRRIEQALGSSHDVEAIAEPALAFSRLEAEPYDLLIVSLTLSSGDGLRFCSRIRARDRTRQTPILVVSDPDETARLLRALDLGVNDYVVRPADGNELRARVRTQMRRRLFTDRLRNLVTDAVELAITDPLTSLYNRRYLDVHLESLLVRATAAQKPVALLLCDIDFFKGINDTYGHDAGDDVLREFSNRLRKGVRGIDLVARYGGEEFVVVMPETDAAYAATVAERLRVDVEREPFLTRGGIAVPVTVSLGLAEFRGAGDSVSDLMRRADQALYAAKREGRNRVATAA